MALEALAAGRSRWVAPLFYTVHCPRLSPLHRPLSRAGRQTGAIFEARASDPEVSKDQVVSLPAFVSTQNSTACFNKMYSLQDPPTSRRPHSAGRRVSGARSPWFHSCFHLHTVDGSKFRSFPGLDTVDINRIRDRDFHSL